MRILCIFIAIVAIYCADNIEIKPVILYHSDINNDYNIVKENIYSQSLFLPKVANNYYVIKSLQSAKAFKIYNKPAQTQNKQLSPSVSISFDNQKTRTIIIKDANQTVPSMQEYSAVKQIYPNAVVETPFKIKIANNMPPEDQIAFSQDNMKDKKADGIITSNNLQISNININNNNKQIQWNLPQILDHNNHVIQNGMEVSLQEAQKSKPTAQPNIISTPPTTADIPKPIPLVNPFSNLKPTFPTEQIKDTSISPNEKQINKQRFQKHRQSLMFIVGLVVLLLIIFVVIQWKKKQVDDVWSNVTNKLQRYQSTSIQVIDDDELTLKQRKNEFLEDEEY